MIAAKKSPLIWSRNFVEIIELRNGEWGEIIAKGAFPESIEERLEHRECVSTGALGAPNRRSLEHHLLHPLILRSRVLFYRTDCTSRSKFLSHALSCYK